MLKVWFKEKLMFCYKAQADAGAMKFIFIEENEATLRQYKEIEI